MQLLPLLLCSLICANVAQNLGYASCFGNYRALLNSNAVASGLGGYIAGEDFTYTTAMCAPQAQTYAGSCWKVVCASGKTGGMACKAGTSVNVRVIDQLGNSCGGNAYSNHVFDLNDVAFDKIASDGASCSGEFNLNYSPINCQTAGLVSGGVKVGIPPNACDPWCPAFTFSNVGDSGALYSVAVSTNGGSSWNSFNRNSGNGARWDCGAGSGTYLGKSLSFRLVSCASGSLPGSCTAGQTVTLTNVLPTGWCVGGATPCGATSYQASANFGTVTITPTTPPTTTTPPTSPPPSSTPSSGGTVRCGTDWTDANGKCGTACPSGTDAECPSGQHCFNALAVCAGSTPPPSTPPTSTTPPPTSTTPPPTTTSPPATAAGDIIGIWRWTWSSSVSPPSGTNLGIAFSGQLDPNLAISDSSASYSTLPGKKYLSLGGGNAVGHWTAASLTTITNALNNNVFSAYDGLAFDIEEGDSGLASAFSSAFAAAKAKGKGVLVTVSHAEPYGIGDAASLMSSILANSNVDYVSPQLYTTGTETANDYTEGTTKWTDYAGKHALFVPSLASGSLYASAQSYFAGKGITCRGYIQWQQTSSGGGSTPTTPTTPPSGSVTVRCGTDWTDANGKCGTACPSGTDAECPSGQHCFNALAACSGSTPPTSPPPSNPTPTPAPTGTVTVRCGTSWADANGKCGTACPSGTDAECPSGQHCYNALASCSGSTPPTSPPPSNPTPTPTPAPTGSVTVRCGTSWADANGKCGTACPSGTDAECPSGQHCFNALAACSGSTPPTSPPPSNPTPTPTPTPAPTGSGTVRCGTSWADANGKCGTACPSGTDAQCPSGQHCYNALAACSTSTPPPSTPTPTPKPTPTPTPTPKPTPTPTPTGTVTVRCGTSWADANGKCGTACPSGTDAQCPSGQHCYNALAACSASTPPPSTPTPTPATRKDLRCGTSWADANGRCGTLCPGGTDAQCPSGQHCYNALATTPCGSNANVATLEDEQQTTTDNNGGWSNEIPGWGIALVTLAAVIVVLLTLVLVLVVRRR